MDSTGIETLYLEASTQRSGRTSPSYYPCLIRSACITGNAKLFSSYILYCFSHTPQIVSLTICRINLRQWQCQGDWDAAKHHYSQWNSPHRCFQSWHVLYGIMTTGESPIGELPYWGKHIGESQIGERIWLSLIWFSPIWHSPIWLSPIWLSPIAIGSKYKNHVNVTPRQATH